MRKGSLFGSAKKYEENNGREGQGLPLRGRKGSAMGHRVREQRTEERERYYPAEEKTQKRRRMDGRTMNTTREEEEKKGQ